MPQFLSNPAKLTAALTALHRHLRTDGVVCYMDPTLEAEALGYTLSWEGFPPRVTDRAPLPAALAVVSEEARALGGRVGVALEVVRRLRGTLRDEPVLLAGLAGPIRIGQEILEDDFGAHLAARQSAALALLEHLARLTLRVARDLCQAGADAVLVAETFVPPAALDAWQTALAPVWNVIYFHEVLPLLFAGGSPVAAAMKGRPPVCVQPLPLDDATPPQAPFGLALPVEQGLSYSAWRWITSGRCVLVTTEDQISHSSSIQELEGRINRFRADLAGLDMERTDIQP